MNHRKSTFPDAAALGEAIAYARGEKKVPLVIRNAQWLDVFSGQFRTGDLAIAGGMIVGVGEDYEGDKVLDAQGLYAVPGFIDSHVHVESSLMTPARFQEAALPSGTTTAIWDPHEIANVLGMEGIHWALDAVNDLLIDIHVMVPSCVPSTNPELEFESSGATLKAADIRSLVGHPRVLGLAEMMNFPGLLHRDADIMQKIMDYHALRLDGHCPGLSGKDLNAYAVAGIHSCHESTSLAEAREKLSKGIHVLIREGSCAKDADALLPLLDAYSSSTVGLCSDDRNPLDILEEGHISFIINKALQSEKHPADIFRAASYATARLYGLHDRGALAPGYLADICLIEPKGEHWRDGMRLKTVIKRGHTVNAAELKKQRSPLPTGARKNLNLPAPRLQDLVIPASGSEARVRIIEVIPQQILTRETQATLNVSQGKVQADPARDILKITVLERHHQRGYRSTALVQGFGIKRGAIATSINHDSHNIIAVGSHDELILAAIEDLIRIDGGIVVRSDRGEEARLALPIAGLMTDSSPDAVAHALRGLKALARSIGCVLSEPFLQLSFLALPVIPSLKITDRGLIDVQAFCKVPVVFESP
ncbi:MAG TPA: adenine deaminase [Oligoflexus sp.]|uniref:adenine deaminase n=1 Tax=Oligoflexus sp. TaxID=1971216 RepID=UPI002D7F2A0C|nr:adenine deaminase [Oligoflexus sp.]HET9240880.1 adenine deaminase [Oligoflexus sp.]